MLTRQCACLSPLPIFLALLSNPPAPLRPVSHASKWPQPAVASTHQHMHASTDSAAPSRRPACPHCWLLQACSREASHSAVASSCLSNVSIKRNAMQLSDDRRRLLAACGCFRSLHHGMPFERSLWLPSSCPRSVGFILFGAAPRVCVLQPSLPLLDRSHPSAALQRVSDTECKCPCHPSCLPCAGSSVNCHCCDLSSKTRQHAGR